MVEVLGFGGGGMQLCLRFVLTMMGTLNDLIAGDVASPRWDIFPYTCVNAWLNERDVI